jgi:hypothetical protein
MFIICNGVLFRYTCTHYIMWVRVMVFVATFNDISVLSWWSLLLVEETRVSWENHITDKLYHIILYRVHLAWAGLELTTLVVIGTECIGSYKSNYHTITTAPYNLIWFIVFNATFSNISATSWRPVLVVEEAGVPGENHRPWANNWSTLSLSAASWVHHFL